MSQSSHHIQSLSIYSLPLAFLFLRTLKIYESHHVTFIHLRLVQFHSFKIWTRESITLIRIIRELFVFNCKRDLWFWTERWFVLTSIAFLNVSVPLSNRFHPEKYIYLYKWPWSWKIEFSGSKHHENPISSKERRCAGIIFFISTTSPRENYSGGSRTLLYNEGNGYANRTEETPPRSFRDKETKRRSFQGCLSQIYREPRSMDKLLLDVSSSARHGPHAMTEMSPPFLYTLAFKILRVSRIWRSSTNLGLKCRFLFFFFFC